MVTVVRVSADEGDGVGCGDPLGDQDRRNPQLPDRGLECPPRRQSPCDRIQAAGHSPGWTVSSHDIRRRPQHLPVQDRRASSSLPVQRHSPGGHPQGDLLRNHGHHVDRRCSSHRPGCRASCHRRGSHFSDHRVGQQEQRGRRIHRGVPSGGRCLAATSSPCRRPPLSDHLHRHRRQPPDQQRRRTESKSRLPTKRAVQPISRSSC